jgi:hypothetical protein
MNRPCNLLSDTVYCFALGAHEIRVGEWQDALPAIVLCAVLQADRCELSARNRDATLLL